MNAEIMTLKEGEDETLTNNINNYSNSYLKDRENENKSRQLPDKNIKGRNSSRSLLVKVFKVLKQPLIK